MIVVDTCVLVFDALAPERLSPPAAHALEEAERAGELVCCDISLWEIAMLIERGRLDPGTDALTFLSLVLRARAVRVESVSPEIAVLSTALGLHGDPADRLIAATAVHLGATLVTSDGRLRGSSRIATLW